MWDQSAIFENSWPPFCQIWIIFTHLKLWIASARHNFKWVKIQIESFGGERVIAGIADIINPSNAKIFLYKAWKPKIFFRFENIIISQLALSASFEYLCCGSKVVINILILSTTLYARIWRLQTSLCVIIWRHVDVILWRIKTVPALRGLTASNDETKYIYEEQTSLKLNDSINWTLSKTFLRILIIYSQREGIVYCKALRSNRCATSLSSI